MLHFNFHPRTLTRVSVAGAIVAGLVGFLVAAAEESNLLIPWQSLGQPPKQPIRIMASHILDIVYAEAVSGDVYLCDLRHSSGSCWTPAKDFQEWQARELAKDPTRVIGDHCPPLKRSPLPLSNTVATSESRECGRLWHRVVIYALRNDGSVFAWQKYEDVGSVISYTLYPVTGFALGCLGLMPLFAFGTYVLAKNAGRGAVEIPHEIESDHPLHSRLGILSVTIGLTLTMGLCALVLGAPHFVYQFTPMLGLLGIGFGAMGLYENSQTIRAAVLGLVLNVVILSMIVCIVVLNLAV